MSEPAWVPLDGSDEGTVFDTFKLDKFTGQEVCVNYRQVDTTIGQMFYLKWKSVNESTVAVQTVGNYILTNVKIAGQFYPVEVRLIQGTFPLVLGKDFFSRYKWSEPSNLVINTQNGVVNLKQEGELQLIDEKTTMDNKMCEEVFLTEPNMEAQLKKLHQYFGHCSGESLIRLINNSSRKDQYKSSDIKKVCEECKTCKLTSRRANKKKTSLPKATYFNQAVSLDLKVHGDSTYVLWAVDEATRLIRGEVMHEKTPEAMMKALDNIWITGRGVGPGLPERYFLTDNGTEFLNETFKSMLQAAGISLKTTSTYSPQQNGTNERNHATADIIVRKYMMDNPEISLQDAVDRAAWAKNSIITSPQGFSPFQLVYGRNPTIPGWSDCTTGALTENLSDFEVARKIIENMQNIRIQYMKLDSDRRIQLAFKDRLPKASKVPFNQGDEVIFFNPKHNKSQMGKIIGFDGPSAHVNSGQTTHKIQIRDLLHNIEKKVLDSDKEDTPEDSGAEEGDEETSESEEIQEIQPTRKCRKRKKSIDLSEEKTEKELEREMVRIDKQREAEREELESDPDQNRLQLTLWSESEEEKETRPKRYKQVQFENVWNEKFEGKVMGVHRNNNRKIWVEVAGEKMNIDLDNIKKWRYKPGM
jgi:hypothetical protein